jgi:large subunit ribosomal protein L6
VTCPSATSITVKGISKWQVGEFAAQVRRSRPAEPYNLKGIKYRDEVVRRKAGKTFVTGAT